MTKVGPMDRLRIWRQNFNHLNLERLGHLLWVGLTFLFLGLFSKISWELHEDETINSLDKQILVLISKFRISTFNGPAVDITALGSPTVITLFTIAGVALLWVSHDRRGSTYLGVGSIGSGLWTWVLKEFFFRARPTIIPRLIEVSGFSYPSGHSLTATSFYLLLMFLTWRYYKTSKARIVLIISTAIVILGICFSRIYLGVHYPSDVLSGFLIGAAWVCLLTYYFFEKGKPLHLELTSVGS